MLTSFLVNSDLVASASPAAGLYTPQGVIDQTPTSPLGNPVPSSFAPRYISGFGQDDTFTIFFEDRSLGSRISFVQTTTGILGLPAAVTPTNIIDTHFIVKAWPWPDNGPIQYLYRGWGAVGNNPDHRFYGSNNLTSWTLLSTPTFQIPNDPGFLNADGFVFYGFHDIIRIPQSSGPNPYVYYAWGESNGGQTMLVRSDTGSDDWVAIAGIGGTDPGNGPLTYPESGTPSGSFFDLGYDRGYGMLQIRGNDSGLYLAVNTDARSSLPPGQFEAAFIDPNNWTWNDDTTGLMSSPLYSSTAEHDFREAWLVPHGNPADPWVVIYDADYGAADGGLALGYLTINPALPPILQTLPSQLPETGFAPGAITRVPAQPDEKLYSKTDILLEIPTLNIKLPIVGVPQCDNGWDVTWLGDNIGWLNGSAFPTWGGNTVLTGHVWSAWNQPGPFVNLRDLTYGDQVAIHAWGQVYTYEVRESKLISSRRIATAFQHEEYDWITLLSCERYNPISEEYIFRRLVRAVLVKVE